MSWHRRPEAVSAMHQPIVVDDDVRRVSGEVPCHACGGLLRLHPMEHSPEWLSFAGEPFLRRLCDGTLGKL